MKKMLARGEGMGGGVRRPRRLGLRSKSERPRTPRAYLAVVTTIAIPFLLASVNATVGLPPAASPSTLASALAPPLRYDELSTISPAALPEHSVILTVENGDTLDAVLTAGGMSRGAAATLNAQFGKVLDLRRLRPGNLLRFHYDAAHEVDSVEMKITGWGEVDAVRGANGFEVTTREAMQREIETTVAANIDSSLYEALRTAGENPQLVQQLVDVFQWDIDFFALRKGDAFSLVVKKKYSGDDAVGYGPIVAATFTHEGQTFEAFRDESTAGRGGYYSRMGTPLRKQFLRAPLQFSRITSTFSNHRFHPLLHYFRPHHGVDYGAPVGTPVMTTADGVVIDARYNAGEGNFVRIRHSSRIETSYLHLSRFAKNIRRGTKVTQGDVIGYVGMTGLATGPHLDYRVSDGGTWLDPLKLKSITPDPLRGDSLHQFRARVVQLVPKLAAPAPQVARVAAKRRALF
ncbi:MAG: Peptidase [Acidobacteria bacterium]|nr:Peptidase [Acidobacteriota bacterium]